MIVRDAAPFIEETLSSVAAIVDHWIVVDTGSVDDTAAVVERFFESRAIPGTMHVRPWHGFAHNRTEAIALCRGHGDYALMVDADDLLVGSPPLEHLDADCYRLRFGPDFTFWRPALFKMSRRWEFRGAVHEYAACLDEGATFHNLIGPYHLVFRSLGGRANDPQRFQKDVEALNAEWQANPPDPRTAFYLAQSHRDAGDDPQALHWYRQRADMLGWDEEIFVAALEVAKCLERAGAGVPEVVAAYMAAWVRRPTRAEPLYEIARWHRAHRRWDEGYLAACRAAAIALPDDDLLFVPADVYRWRIADERSICAHYLGLHGESAALCDDLLRSADLPLGERARVLFNRNLSLAHLAEGLRAYRPDLVEQVLENVNASPVDPQVTLTITTCRRRDLFERTVDSFLACCRDRLQIDRWICIDDGSSDDDRATMQQRYPFFEFILRSSDDRGHAGSMNRLLQEVRTPYWLHLEDDWDFVSADNLVSHARQVLDDDVTLLQVVLNRNYAETFEQQRLVGGQVVRTAEGGMAYRRHTHLAAGSTELDELLKANPGCATNAHWPGFSLMPSMMRTESIKQVGAFNPASAHFERDMAERAEAAGWSIGFLDTITCVTTGRLRGDTSADAPLNAYQLNEMVQFEPSLELTVGVLGIAATDAEVIARWGRQFPAERSWRGVRLMGSPDEPAEPDYWVLVNHPSEGEMVPRPERTIVLQTEPAAIVATWGEWAAPNPTSFLQVRSHDFAPNPTDWHLDLSYDDLWTKAIVKTSTLSAVASGEKHKGSGHHVRTDFLLHLERCGFPVDVYGEVNDREESAGYPRPVPSVATSAGLLPYSYTLAIEDFAEVNYFTEKVTDAILAECLPFYWGCPNLADYVDPEAFIRLPIDDFETSRQLISDAIGGGERERRLPAIRRAKRRILDELQLAPTLARVVHGHRLVEQMEVRVINLDRRPDRLAAFDARLVEACGEGFAGRCERFAAIDGAELTLTDDIAHMFRGTPVLRRAETACAISHLALWWEVATGDGRPTLIFEDDAEPVHGFYGRLVEVCGRLTQPGASVDVVLLGLSHSAQEWVPNSHSQDLRPLETAGVMGGGFAYLITQQGARRLWEIAQQEGIAYAIDTFLLRQGGALDICQAVPALAVAAVARRGETAIDSDIQYDATTL